MGEAHIGQNGIHLEIDQVVRMDEKVVTVAIHKSFTPRLSQDRDIRAGHSVYLVYTVRSIRVLKISGPKK